MKPTAKYLFFVLVTASAVWLFFSPSRAGAEEGTPVEHDHAGHAAMEHSGHAMDGMHHGSMVPVGVMGGHNPGAGQWMLSYRYMHMDMDGNRDGNDSLSTSEVLDDFMVAPLEMTMDMHMLGVMYGLTDRLSAMVMIPYVVKSMDHRTRMGAEFETETEGLGDIRMSALFTLYEDTMHRLSLTGGLSLPTGSIDEEDDTPAGDDQQLPYPMQLGSGTWDIIPGLTYVGNLDRWSWGVQGLATIRLDENDRDYTLGDRYDLSTWLSFRFIPELAGSVRLNGLFWGDIDGQDDELNPMMVPTADPDLRSGQRVDLLFGLDFAAPGALTGLSLGVEGGFPVHQDLDGPQLETDWLVTAGLMYHF